MSEKLELILSLIDNPKEAIEVIIVEKPVLLSFIIFIIATLSLVVSNLVSFNLGSHSLIFQLIFSILFVLVFVVITACWFHFVAELLKGDGNVITLYSLLNYSLLPLTILMPASIISKFVGIWFLYFSVIVALFWIDYLVVISLKMLYDISLSKVLVVMMSPLIVFTSLVFIILILSIIGIISLLI
ncbi:MAG: hypothetical protein A2474_01065 [Elusimicrobia bacterium RIFOXYC2_FULL_34_12]|nr:MAG: hypothetical protein A2474_01065 [Elusimicrobia bacterium RIFOXYC2_FULL_34_12]